MKSDGELLRNMKQQQKQAERALLEESAREVELFHKYVKSENIAPDTRHFSITRMKFIPLWTIYASSDEHYSQGYYISSTGRLYELRDLIAIKTPASRSGKIHVSGALRHMREEREKKVSGQPVKKKRRAPWR
jgi:hypothetical protein